MTLIRNRTLASRTSGDIIRKIHAFALTCDCEYVWILYSHYDVVELFQSFEHNLVGTHCMQSVLAMDTIDWCSQVEQTYSIPISHDRMGIQYLVTPLLMTEHQWGIVFRRTRRSADEQVVDVAPSDRTYSKKIGPWYFC